jgi:hypothetical protein
MYPNVPTSDSKYFLLIEESTTYNEILVQNTTNYLVVNWDVPMA